MHFEIIELKHPSVPLMGLLAFVIILTLTQNKTVSTLGRQVSINTQNSYLTDKSSSTQRIFIELLDSHELQICVKTYSLSPLSKGFPLPLSKNPSS